MPELVPMTRFANTLPGSLAAVPDELLIVKLYPERLVASLLRVVTPVIDVSVAIYYVSFKYPLSTHAVYQVPPIRSLRVSL